MLGGRTIRENLKQLNKKNSQHVLLDRILHTSEHKIIAFGKTLRFYCEIGSLAEAGRTLAISWNQQFHKDDTAPPSIKASSFE